MIGTGVKSFLIFVMAAAFSLMFSLPGFAADYGNHAPMSCASQGRWTRRALEQTHNISQYITQLKDMKECKGIEGLSAVIAAEESSLGMPSGDQMDSGLDDGVEGAPSRLSSLLDSAQSFVSNSSVSGGARASVFQAMLQQNLGTGLFRSSQSSSDDMTVKYGTSLRNSANYLDQLTTMIPQYNECFMKHADQGAALLASVVNLTASYASSGEGIVATLGNSVGRVLRMLRDSRLTNALGVMSRAEFRNSISCLIETTTENYCGVMDAHHLAQTANQNYGITLSDDPSNPNFAHPLAGFYVLTQHLPNVNQWIQNIQLGVEPHWGTDAELQNKTIDVTYGFIKAAKDLLGKFSEERFNYVNTIKKDDLTAKKAAVLHILTLMVASLNTGVGGMQAAGEAASLNQFITQTVIPQAIPFYIISPVGDRQSIPLRVAINQTNLPKMNWDDYLKGGGNFIDPDGKTNGFDNPDHLLDVMEINLKSLLQDAQIKANDYYRSRLIVNQPNLVVKALVGLPRSVRTSLIVIDNYIMDLESRMLSSGFLLAGSDELKVIGQMNVTHYHLRTILNAYDQLNFAQNMPIHTDADWEAVDAPYKNVVETAYRELDIIRQRDSYLMAAVTNYVDLDYMFRVRHGLDLTRYEQDLLTVSANNLSDLLTSVHGIAPAELQNDLANAHDINSKNLDALEMAFGDNIYPIMDELFATVTGGDVSDWGLFKKSMYRWREDVMAKNGAAKQDNPVLSYLPDGIFALFRRWLHPDQYPINVNLRGTVRQQQDDSYDDETFLLSKLCVQTLAFTKRDRYKSLCMKLYGGKGAMLYSPLTAGGAAIPPTDLKDFDLTFSYADAINGARGDKTSQSNRDYIQNNICAYRNWMRRNVAYFLTQDMHNGANSPNADLQSDADHAQPYQPPVVVAKPGQPQVPGQAQSNVAAPRTFPRFHLVKDEPNN